MGSGEGDLSPSFPEGGCEEGGFFASPGRAAVTSPQLLLLATLPPPCGQPSSVAEQGRTTEASREGSKDGPLVLL